jgi:curved DNA-binding protein CbpA
MSLRRADFKDFYAVLGVERSASSEEIATAYHALATQYHPNTPRTGDRAMFAKVNEAYEVLSDPAARAEYEKSLAPATVEIETPRFSGPKFFDSLRESNRRRLAVLCVLFDHRQRNPARPTMTFRELEPLLALTTDELNFTLWFLRQRGLVLIDDKSSMQVTVDGMEYLERQSPSPDDVMGFIRAPQ